MRMPGVRNWLTGTAPPAAVIAAASALAAGGLAAGRLDADGPDADGWLPHAHSRCTGSLWSEARIKVAEGLWGQGFLLPGGESEILRCVRQLGVSGSGSLLLIGAGPGGPACAIARELGIWVSGFEADPILTAFATERALQSGLGKRVQIDGWDPADPAFRIGAYHHALALEPLRGARAEPVLAAIAEALKPTGHFVLQETVGNLPSQEPDSDLAAWARLENRGPELPSEDSITRILGRLGFEVRRVEDVSERHTHLAVLGWRLALRGIGQKRPSPLHAALLVREAELWFRRLQLLQAGQLSLVRWHAVRKPGHAANSPEVSPLG